MFTFLTADIYSSEHGSRINLENRQGLVVAQVDASKLDSTLLVNINEWLRTLKAEAGSFFSLAPALSLKEMLTELKKHRELIEEWNNEIDVRALFNYFVYYRCTIQSAVATRNVEHVELIIYK